MADSIDRPATAESTHWRPVFPGQSGSASGEPHCCAWGTHRLDVASCDRLVSLSSRFLIVTSPRRHVTCSSGNVRSSSPCCGRSKHVNRCDGMVATPLAVPCAHFVVERERASPVGIFYCFSTFSGLSELSQHHSLIGAATRRKESVCQERMKIADGRLLQFILKHRSRLSASPRNAPYVSVLGVQARLRKSACSDGRTQNPRRSGLHNLKL